MTSSDNFLLILNSKDDIKLKLDSEQSFVYSINSGSLKMNTHKVLILIRNFIKLHLK